MKPTTALYFPETIARNRQFRQLLLFLDGLRHYLPCEESATPDSPLVQAGLLEQHLPLPLGDDLDSFKRLIADITAQGSAFYGSCLSAISNSAAGDIDEASIWKIIEGMSSKNRDQDPKRADTLLQARLLLRLFEINQQEEEEIDQEIDRLQEKNRALIEALKGGSAALDIDPAVFRTQESQERLKRRFRAWGHLFMADKTPPPWLLAGENQEILEEMQECLPLTAQRDPFMELTLALPPEADSHEGYINFRAKLHEETAPWRSALLKGLRQCAASGRAVIESADIAKWNDSQATNGKDSATLGFYILPQPLPELLRQTCGLPDAPGPVPGLPHTIVAILTPSN